MRLTRTCEPSYPLETSEYDYSSLIPKQSTATGKRLFTSWKLLSSATRPRHEFERECRNLSEQAYLAYHLPREQNNGWMGLPYAEKAAGDDRPESRSSTDNTEVSEDVAPNRRNESPRTPEAPLSNSVAQLDSPSK